ncbi:hypothetical protein BASA61_008222 [Batrachochytrium salamandrivorans]|nr:hypothetical protein BASA61_008222 [Batrachochytrium salamandrivorans]
MDPRYANDPAYVEYYAQYYAQSRQHQQQQQQQQQQQYAMDPRYAQHYARQNAIPGSGPGATSPPPPSLHAGVDPNRPSRTGSEVLPHNHPPSDSQYQPHYQRAVANPGYDHPIDGGVPPQAHPGVSSGFPGSYVHPSGMQQPVVDPRYAQHHGRQTSGSPQYSNDPRYAQHYSQQQQQQQQKVRPQLLQQQQPQQGYQSRPGQNFAPGSGFDRPGHH